MRLTEDEDTMFDPREEELILRETAELRADEEDELERRVVDAIFELRVAEEAAFESLSIETNSIGIFVSIRLRHSRTTY